GAARVEAGPRDRVDALAVLRMDAREISGVRDVGVLAQIEQLLPARARENAIGLWIVVPGAEVVRGRREPQALLRLAQGRLAAAQVEGVGENVRDALHEVDVVHRETRLVRRMHARHAGPPPPA